MMRCYQRLGMVPAAPTTSASNDMSVAELLAQLGTDRFIVEKRGEALVLEMLDQSKPAPTAAAAPQAGGLSRKHFEAVVLKFSPGAWPPGGRLAAGVAA